jgi:acetyl-CoA C-acetyltransferase
MVADLAPEAALATEVSEVVETLDGYRGAASVATYTVTYDGLEPVRTVALCDTADGRRCVAISDDPGVAARAVESELIGTSVSVDWGSLDLT